MEVIAFVGADRHKTGCHGKAVEVARNVAVHVGQTVSVEVVRGGEREVPVLGGPYVARKAQVLRYPWVVFHLLLVECSVAVAYTIIKCKAPWHRPFGVSFLGKLYVGIS